MSAASNSRGRSNLNRSQFAHSWQDLETDFLKGDRIWDDSVVWSWHNRGAEFIYQPGKNIFISCEGNRRNIENRQYPNSLLYRAFYRKEGVWTETTHRDALDAQPRSEGLRPILTQVGEEIKRLGSCPEFLESHRLFTPINALMTRYRQHYPHGQHFGRDGSYEIFTDFQSARPFLASPSDDLLSYYPGRQIGTSFLLRYNPSWKAQTVIACQEDSDDPLFGRRRNLAFTIHTQVPHPIREGSFWKSLGLRKMSLDLPATQTAL